MPLHDLKRRFVQLALRRAMPRTSWLPYARLGLLGLAAVLAGGLLFTLACAALLGAFFFYLRDQGIGPAYALLILSATSLLPAAGIFFATERFVFRKLDKEPPMLSPGQPEDALLDIPSALLSGFLQGMLNGSGSDTPRPRH